MVDIKNANDILPYLMRDGVDIEFKEIRSILKENLRNSEKYCSATVSNKAKNIYEMRFTRSGRNDRIYCQEIRKNKTRFIVMVELYESKKSQKIPPRIKQRIEKMGGYEYEFN